MLSKFFTSLTPKEYSVQVLQDNTSQSAVKRIKRTRTSAPFKKISALMLAFAILGGGLASASAATAMTAKQAQANIFADMICIKADEDNSGAWNGGANLWSVTGGRAQFSMHNITKTTIPQDAAYNGYAGTWGRDSPSQGGKYLTAYEKYGMNYPIFDAWVPVFADKEITVKQVNTHKGSYDAGGKIPVKDGGNKLEAGASPLTTSNIGSCMALLPSVSAGIANMISVMPRFVMGASIDLFGAAYGTSISEKDSILYPIGKSIDRFITQPGGLKDSLFIPFILPIILIGAIWVGYKGVVKRETSTALMSTVWMIGAIAAGTVFLAQPTSISAFADSTVSAVQRTFNDAVLEPSKSNRMCDLEGSRDKKAEIRETKCALWHSTIYSPWVAGQFGAGANSAHGEANSLTKEAGRNVLNNDQYKIYYGANNSELAYTWPQFMIDRQATTRSPELSEVAWAQLSGQGGAAINSEWAGSLGMVSASILMFFGAGASSAVLVVYGFTLLIYQLMMVTAVLLSPFFFLFGIVPNWGRRVLMRYAELIVSLMVKRIVTGGLLTFYLIFYTLVIGDGASAASLMLKIILIFALAIFFISARKKFVKMFADNINFGGNKSIGLPGNKAAAVGAGIGVGLLGGGLIGGAIVASKMKKMNKEHEDISGNVGDIKLEGGSPTAPIKPAPKGGTGGGNSGGQGGGNSGGSGDKGGSGAPVSPLKTVGKVVNVAEDANRAKNLVDEVQKKRAASARRAAKLAEEAAKNSAQEAAGSSQSASNASGSASSSTGPNVAPKGAQQAQGQAQQQAQQKANQMAAQKAAEGKSGVATVKVTKTAQGVQGAGSAATSGGTTAASTGGAAATVAPVAPTAAAATTSASAGVTAGGAAATAGVTAGGAAATAGAGGAAAAGGAVAAGAAAGSVVPVVGTIAGAALAATVVGMKKKQEQEKDEE